ncbi:MAG: SMI1/KNR4 family protein [Myxococcales bacterium]|nr:SMI1/KNR4 family protein [Myxococcales bacterium]MCB9566020.1 SMI1/KNR4 family protein [Myxococcales bacterium]MCB9702799.1 SMI1/KNR4 family protein [Myxococcales bacterium]
MSPAPFRPRLEAMLAALRAHPEVELLDVQVRPPASEAAIRGAAASIDASLPPELVAFYREHDGVFVEWGLRGQSYAAPTDPFGWPDYGQPPGCINILPIAEVMSPEWEIESHVNEISSEQQALIFGAPLDPQPPVRAVTVDNFSKYNHGDLILGPDPVMVVSTDHGADMEASDWLSFGVYLDLTLAIFATNRYYQGVGIGWSRTPQRVDAWTARPSLDDLIARIREDEA